jgi:hypothetical protein
MIDDKKRPENTNEPPGLLRRVILDEPLNVWVSSCEPEHLGAALSACSKLPRHGGVTLVLSLTRDMLAAEATRTLARAGAIADTLVLIASDEDRLRWGALGTNDLRAAARGTGSVRVLIEPDPKRAVVGSMQWLRPAGTFCVVWPREQYPLDLEALIALGSSWRGAWEPEKGEFHARPRGPDGFYTWDYQAAEERTKQGEDR